MHKIGLIIKREYLTRVRKRTFIISTLLFPILYMGLIFGTGYLAGASAKNAYCRDRFFWLFYQTAIAKENATDKSTELDLGYQTSGQHLFQL